LQADPGVPRLPAAQGRRVRFLAAAGAEAGLRRATAYRCMAALEPCAKCISSLCNLIVELFRGSFIHRVLHRSKSSAAGAAIGFQAQGLEGVFGPYVSQT